MAQLSALPSCRRPPAHELGGIEGVPPAQLCDSTLGEVHLRRLSPREITRWKRYAVTLDGHDVGMVVEDHEWKGSRYGSARWYSGHVEEVHQEEPRNAKPACWVSAKLRTRTEAVEALRVHLARCTMPDVDGDR